MCAMASSPILILTSARALPEQAPCTKTKEGRKRIRGKKIHGSDEGRLILAEINRPRTLGTDDSLLQILKLPCEEKGALVHILQVYLSSLALCNDEQKEISCRCQKLLWRVAARSEWSDEVLLFSDHVMEMAVDPNWNFLLQHIVTLCDIRQLEVVCSRLSGHVCKLARHRIGCRILCRICEQGKFSEATFQLLLELASDISEHITHSFSNFVVVKILENFQDFPGMDAALMSCATRWSVIGS